MMDIELALKRFCCIADLPTLEEIKTPSGWVDCGPATSKTVFVHKADTLDYYVSEFDKLNLETDTDEFDEWWHMVSWIVPELWE